MAPPLKKSSLEGVTAQKIVDQRNKERRGMGSPYQGKGNLDTSAIGMALQDPDAAMNFFRARSSAGSGSLRTDQGTLYARIADGLNKDIGSGLGGFDRSKLMGGGAHSEGTGGGVSLANDMVDPYQREKAQYEDRARFDAEMARRAMQSQSDMDYAQQKRVSDMRLDMISKLLGLPTLGGSGKSTTSTETTSGNEYFTIGGRPVSMPTKSSSKRTVKEKGYSAEAMLSALLGMLNG